jgi:hypothetical protein
MEAGASWWWLSRPQSSTSRRSASTAAPSSGLLGPTLDTEVVASSAARQSRIFFEAAAYVRTCRDCVCEQEGQEVFREQTFFIFLEIYRRNLLMLFPYFFGEMSFYFVCEIFYILYLYVMNFLKY